jgi:dTDP-4-dehydrorhamnose reductase
MASIALLGSQGQLGSELAAVLPTNETRCLTRADADLAIPGQVTQLLEMLRPGVVINCSAYNLVDKAEDDPAVAFAVNAFGVRELALACAKLNATLIHFSTDYVFGLEGFRGEPYRESDAPGPVSTYGISKLTGEYFVRALCPRHYVIRTCGLYSPHGAGGKGTNFVQTMLRLARAGKPLKVVEDQILTPTSAKDVARAIPQLLEECPFGLYHLTNSGQCSWLTFARTIFELAGVTADLSPTTSAEYGSRAVRPAYSVLATEHASAPRLRPWQDALAEYVLQQGHEESPKIRCLR